MNNNGKRQNCDNKNHDGDGDDESETYLELLKFCLVKWGPSILTNCIGVKDIVRRSFGMA